MTRSDLLRRILVPLDGSELATIAIPWARALATPETDLVLFRAVPDPTPFSELAGTSAFPAQRVTARNRHVAADYLDAVAEVLLDVTGTISTASTVGDASEEILRAIEERDATMVVVASHGRGFLGRVVVGSVADRVARSSAVPVLVVHPSKHASMPAHADSTARIDRMVVPLDGSVLARQALPVAAALGLQLGIPLHLVRAVPNREEIAAYPDSLEADDYSAMIAAAASALEAKASQLRAAGLTVTGKVAFGPPAATILDEIGSHDLVVMTSHGQGGVRRWLLGSVAERLIRSGEAPVLLVPVMERVALTGKAI
jgi:nucleotide-binding universal stress UspA family protein